MPNALVPEFAASDFVTSRAFYCDVLGFTCVYDRPEDGFAYLALRRGAAHLNDEGRPSPAKQTYANMIRSFAIDGLF